MWAPPPTTPTNGEGVAVVRGAPTYSNRVSHIDIFNDTGETTAAINRIDDWVLALEALSGARDRDDFTERPIRASQDPEAPGASRNARAKRKIIRANIALMGPVTRVPRDIDQRPQQRALSRESQAVVDKWFNAVRIAARSGCKTIEQRDMAAQLVYTYRDLFATQLADIKPTDLLEHTVNLMPNAIPYRLQQPRYTPQERDFARRIFPQIEEIGWIKPGIAP